MTPPDRKLETANRKPFFPDWPYLLGLGLMGLALFGYRLGAPGLMDPDEGRYAEIAREMFVLQDWLIPHLNLFPYLEKPPLIYWLTALSFKTLGYTELAARLPSAAAALGGLLTAYWLARTLWGTGTALVSATVLATCSGYVILGRLLTLDMAFSFLLNLGIALGYVALSRARPRLWPWAYAVLGLAVLTKGPAALVLAGLVWGLWAIFHPLPSPHPFKSEREEELFSPPPRPSPLKGEGVKSRLYARLQPLIQPWSWLLLAVLALPWFMAAQWRQPEFFRYFIGEQHLGRFLTPAIHPEPVYYYLPVLLGLLLPWTFLLPWAVGRRRDGDPDRAFLLIWAGVVLVFFSLSRGKLAPYILPALLPLALLLGQRLAGADESGSGRDGLRLSLCIWGLLGIGITSLLLWPPAGLSRVLARTNLDLAYLRLAAAVFVLTPLLALAVRRRGLLFLGLGALILSTLLPLGLERLSRQRSPREMGRIVHSLWGPGDALVGVYLYSQGLSFYSRQIFHLMESKTELDFGRRVAPERERQLYFAKVGDMAKFVRSRPRVFFYLKEDDLAGLKPELPGKIEVLARQGDCLLLSYEAK
jgi:4-amino-4-deoxy-L-arabinose transferase-like glycosyltransferase